MTTQTLTLADGRLLEYSVAGSTASDALPLIYIHGSPGAYPVMKNLASKCQQHNMKLISFSRAGYGSSTRNPGRKVVDIVGDIEALAAHLNVKRFVAAGWSGGGPHVLACVARVQDCIGALCVAGVAPYNAEGLDYLAGTGEDNVLEVEASLKGEDALREFLEPQRTAMLKSDVVALVEELSTILPEVDKKALLENKDIGENMEQTFHEGLKNSADGWVDDDIAFVEPWGFDLPEVTKPVFLYQGSVDLMVPYGHGVWMSKNLPQENLKVHLLDGEGHLSLWPKYTDNMLKDLSSLRG